MRCVILAGGKGTRLKPYTTIFPKPLVPIGDRPILEIILTQLSHYGINHITMAVSHLAHLIMAYFGDGSPLNMKIDYSLEPKPLSTIAPMKLIKDLPETFFVMNGDILTDINFNELYKYHIRNSADITVATYERDSKIDFGVLETNQDNVIVNFKEKPSYHFNVSMGIYVINRKLLDIVPDGIPFGFDHLMYACLKNDYRAVSFPHKGCWLDIGRPDDYANANEKISDLLPILLPEDK